MIFTLIERRRSTPALEKKIASQVSWTFDGISNFNGVSLASAEMLYTKSQNVGRTGCAKRSVVSFVIKSLMNGVTSQPQSCWSETSRANELSFSIIVSSKYKPLEALRFAKQFKLHCISSHRMFVLLRLFWTASSVFCVKLLYELREGETSALQVRAGPKQSHVSTKREQNMQR